MNLCSRLSFEKRLWVVFKLGKIEHDKRKKCACRLAKAGNLRIKQRREEKYQHLRLLFRKAISLVNQFKC